MLNSNPELSKGSICAFLDRVHREIVVEKSIIERQQLLGFLDSVIDSNAKYLNEMKDVRCASFVPYKVYIITATALKEFVFGQYQDGVNPIKVAETIVRNYYPIVDSIFSSGKIGADVKLILDFD